MENLLPLGIGAQMTKMVERYREDKKMVCNALRRPLEELTYVHEVLSCLVAGVYARDKGDQEPERFWRSVHYEPVEGQKPGAHGLLGNEAGRKNVAVSDAPCARLMLFERKDLELNRGYGRLRLEDGREDTVQWPKYVVAVRGTILSRRDDVIDDVRIVVGTICLSVRLYQPVLRLLMTISRAFPDDEVWVTGHSLGAVLGIIATRRLAIDDEIVLKCHFLYGPNISLDVMAKKAFIGTVHGVASVATKVPICGGIFESAIRGTGSIVSSTAEGVARRTIEFLFRSKFAAARRGFETLRKQDYIPHMYVNPNDAICNDYIRHFEGDQPPAVSNS